MDLNLNTRGNSFCLDQTRVADYLTAFSAKYGIECVIAKDNYVVPVLLKTEILTKMCDTLSAQISETSTVNMFTSFNEEITDAQIQ